jgi:hypothetical protein
VHRPDARLIASDIAIVDTLNPYGASVRSMHPIEPGSRVEMMLPLTPREASVRGRVVHRRETPTPYGTVHVHGVEFEKLEQDTRDAIELHCAQHATPLERQRYEEGPQTAKGVLRRLRNLRGQRRLTVGMPARIVVGVDGASRELGVGLLEDISPQGARLLLDHPVAAGSTLRVQIPGSEYDATGRVAFVRALETSVGMRFIVGFDTGSPSTRPGRGGRRLYEATVRVLLEYGAAATQRSRAAGLAAGRAFSSALAAAKRGWPSKAVPPLDFQVQLAPALAVLASTTIQDDETLDIAALPSAKPASTTIAKQAEYDVPGALAEEPWHADDSTSDSITIPRVHVEVANPFSQARDASGRQHTLAVPSVHVDVTNPFAQDDTDDGEFAIPSVHVEVADPTFPF